LLEASVDSLLLSEDTLPKVTKENEHLQKNVSKLTAQLDETESRLESERAARKAVEEGLEIKVKEVENSWGAVLEEKKDNWEAKEKLLEEKVDDQERLLNELKASYEVTQRLGLSEPSEGSGRSHITSAELEMVNSDLERTSVRLAEVEARNEQLRIELAQSASQVPSQPALALEDDPGYMRMRSENSSLLRKLDASRVERDSRKRELDGKLRSFEREIGMLKEERDSLKSKVQKWSDYEDVKQELEVLKSIEFATGDDEDAQETADSTDAGTLDGASAKGKGDTLEQLLLARNKKLSDELTILRVSHQDLQTRLQSMQEELSRSNGDLEAAQHLNATLENDLAKMQQETVNAYPSAGSVAGTYTSRYPQGSPNPSSASFAVRKGRISPTSSIISGFDPRSSSLGTTSLEALRSGEPVGGGSGILPMITAQRDRFKKRNEQLENELSEIHRTVSSLRQEIASLQKDNLNLYEKTRYVSTYNRAGQTSSVSSYASNPNLSSVQASGSTSSGLALDRYRSAYESNISPFAAFRGRESARAYKRMSLPERIVFSITRMVLATRTSRNLFAGYCVALHVIVFFALYWLGTADAEQHASHLGQAAVAAAAGSIGNAAGANSNHGDWQQEGLGDKMS
jgi:homeobox protein cut-like